MNYYIAGTHFGCTNKYKGRTLEHDKLIKENWNRVITNSDTVYLLGDIGRIGNNKDNEYLCEIISTLKGKEKILVVGNHEQMKDARLRQLFTEITPYKEIVDNYNGLNHKLVLFHFPILFWASQHKGSILLHGHTHMTDEQKFFEKSIKDLNNFFKDKTLKGSTDCPPARAFNVGVMLPYMDYTPRTLKEIMKSGE